MTDGLILHPAGPGFGGSSSTRLGALPDILAVAVTVGLRLWQRNAVLSILAGTVIYAVLVGTLFVG